MSAGERFDRAVAIMARLRAPNGCPWDREQDFDSIKPYTLEETYEVLEAIDARDFEGLRGELGDLLLQVLFYSQMAQEEGRFDIGDVLDRLCEKLISRHPHVFGDTHVKTSADVLRDWEALKAKERAAKASRENAASYEAAPASVLDGISSSMPALMEAFKISSRAANVGFDWPNVQGLFTKLEEETAELQHELGQWPAPGPDPHSRGVAGSGRQVVPAELRARLEDEVGDLLFVLVNLARYLSLDPESALRKTNRKFKRRFQHMEAALAGEGKNIRGAGMEDMERLWQQAKQQEREK